VLAGVLGLLDPLPVSTSYQGKAKGLLRGPPKSPSKRRLTYPPDLKVGGLPGPAVAPNDVADKSGYKEADQECNHFGSYLAPKYCVVVILYVS
jgi:hypothetical protein